MLTEQEARKVAKDLLKVSAAATEAAILLLVTPDEAPGLLDIIQVKQVRAAANAAWDRLLKEMAD